MSSLVCPVCDTEYAGWAPRCSTCGVALVQPGERIDVLALPEDRQIIYELTDWTLDQRTELGQALAESDIPHAWDDSDLVVADVHEELVDEICDAIEGGDGADIGHQGAPDGAVAYELETWTTTQRLGLEERLVAADIPFGWEPGFTLVVATEHEEAVDAIVDELVPDSDDAEGDDEPDDRPEASAEVLSDLFVASDVLVRNPREPEGLTRLTDVIDDVDSCRAPYGVDTTVWDAIADAADELADAILELADDDVVVERATTLRTMVRPFV